MPTSPMPYGPQEITSSVPVEFSEPKLKPLPPGAEALIDWIDQQYPELSIRSSAQEVIDASLMRAGIRELVAFLRHRLEQDREEMMDDTLETS